jgi:hypothetical protein
MSKHLIAVYIFFFAFLTGTAQINVPNLSKKFVAYQEIWPKTKLHLIFNQEKFSPGDTAWFKTYFLSDNLNFIAGKQLIDLHLVNSKGKSIIHFLVSVENGIGANQLVIPDTLSAGIYLITAYSSWMKNFDPALIFKKKIAIVRKKEIVEEKKIVLRAVAEGGHLIKEVANKVSFQSNRVNSSLRIFDQVGIEVQQAVTDNNGVASITFTPTGGNSYFAQAAGDTAKIRLPSIEDDGCSILLTPSNAKEKEVKMIVSSPFSSSLRNEELIVVVSSRGKIYYATIFILGMRQAVELQLSQEILPEGVGHVSVLSGSGKLLASRNFYTHSKSAAEAKINIKKDTFKTREKVTVEVAITDAQGQPIQGEFSCNVLNAALFNEQKRNSLADELNIIAGLKENFIIDRTDPNWITSLDNFLITMTEPLLWDKILSDQIAFPHFHFNSFIEKEGIASYGDTHKPVPDLTQIIFYLQKDKRRYQTSVDKGKFWFIAPDIYGQDELLYVAESSYYVAGTKHGEEISNLEIEWKDEPMVLPGAPPSKEIEVTDRYASYSENIKLIRKSFGFYYSDKKVISSTSASNDFEREVKGADLAINVQNYVVFPTMAELVKEIIPALYHRKIGTKNIVRVKLSDQMLNTATGDPLYVIDGIATKNTAYFLSLKPIDLLTVKVVKDQQKLSRFGMLGKNGIVIVETKNGNAREPLDPFNVIEGVTKPLTYTAVDHSKNDDLHTPDFRSTVYWNPSIKTDSNGKAIVTFYCSDDVGKLTLRVDGLTTNARPFSAEHHITVRLDLEKK